MFIFCAKDLVSAAKTFAFIAPFYVSKWSTVRNSVHRQKHFVTALQQ
jgi:hypothetical protein